MIEVYHEFTNYLWIVGLAGSASLAAAAIYVYLFRRQPAWTNYSVWILNKEAAKPSPHGLVLASFLGSNNMLWRVLGIVSLIGSAVVLNLILSQLGFDFVRSLLGVWFLVWLPQLFGRFTTEVGQPQVVGFFLMLLSQLFIVLGMPVMGVLFALGCAFFLPVGPILVAAGTWSIWPLLGLVVPLVQMVRCRSVKPDNTIPKNHNKIYLLRQRYGFGASHSATILDPKFMLFPWGPLGVIFLIAIGHEAHLEMLLGALIALFTAYLYSIWVDEKSPLFLLGCTPVIVCALMYGRLDLILLAAFLQPFLISKGTQ